MSDSGISSRSSMETPTTSRAKHTKSLQGVTESELAGKRKRRPSTSDILSQEKAARPSPDARQVEWQARAKLSQEKRDLKLNRGRSLGGAEEIEEATQSNMNGGTPSSAGLPATSESTGYAFTAANLVPPSTLNLVEAFFNHSEWTKVKTNTETTCLRVEKLEEDIKAARVESEKAKTELLATIDRKQEESEKKIMNTLNAKLKEAWDMINQLTKEAEEARKKPAAAGTDVSQAVKNEVEAILAKKDGEDKKKDQTESVQLDKCKYNIIVAGIPEQADSKAGKEKERKLLMEKLQELEPTLTYEKDLRYHARFASLPGSKKPLPIRVIFNQKQDVERYLDRAYSNGMHSFWRDWPKFLRDKSRKIKDEVKRLKEQDPGIEAHFQGHQGIVWGYKLRQKGSNPNPKRKNTGESTDTNSSESSPSSASSNPPKKQKQTPDLTPPSDIAEGVKVKPKKGGAKRKRPTKKQREEAKKAKAEAEAAKKQTNDTTPGTIPTMTTAAAAPPTPSSSSVATVPPEPSAAPQAQPKVQIPVAWDQWGVEPASQASQVPQASQLSQASQVSQEDQTQTQRSALSALSSAVTSIFTGQPRSEDQPSAMVEDID